MRQPSLPGACQVFAGRVIAATRFFSRPASLSHFQQVIHPRARLPPQLQSYKHIPAAESPHTLPVPLSLLLQRPARPSRKCSRNPREGQCLDCCKPSIPALRGCTLPFLQRCALVWPACRFLWGVQHSRLTWTDCICLCACLCALSQFFCTLLFAFFGGAAPGGSAAAANGVALAVLGGYRHL